MARFSARPPLFLLVIAFVGCATVGSNDERSSPDDCSLDVGLDRLVGQIIQSLSEKGRSEVAIVELLDLDGEMTTLGKYLAEEMTTRLYSTGQLDVVERQLLMKVIEEQELGISGYIDEDTAASLGHILGVDAIATGTISDLGDEIRVNARLIAAESGSVFSVASATICKDATVKKLMQKSAPSMKPSTNTFGGSAGGSSSTDEPSSSVKEINGFRLELERCGRLGGKEVRCDLKVTALERDRDLSIALSVWGHDDLASRAFDSQGSFCKPHRVKVGNQQRRLGHGSASRDVVAAWLAVKLIEGVPTPANLYFDCINEDAGSLAKLECGCRAADEDFRVVYRNIPIAAP